MALKITLKNFKCWRDNTFEFKSSDGLVLISGSSGQGKSSLIQACLWAVTGECISGGSILRYGATSCSVELCWKNITITRTRRPNRLIVSTNGKTYEDDVAQEYIRSSSLFGPYFQLSGYIQQKGMGSFLVLRPAEKLEILESIAFEHIPLEQMKNKINALISQYNDEHLRLQNEISLVEQELAEHPAVDKLIVPPKYPKGEDERKIYNNDNQKELDKCLFVISAYQLALQLNSKKEAHDMLLAEITLKQAKLITFPTKNITLLEKQVEDLEKWKFYLLIKKELEQAQQQYQETKEAHEKTQADELAELVDITVEEAKTQLESAQEYYSTKERLKSLEKELSTISLSKKTELEQEICILNVQLTKLSEKIRTSVRASIVQKCPFCIKDLIVVGDEIVRLGTQRPMSPTEHAMLLQEEQKVRTEKTKLDTQYHRACSAVERSKNIQAQIDEIKEQFDESNLSSLDDFIEQYNQAQRRHKITSTVSLPPLLLSISSRINKLKSCAIVPKITGTHLENAPALLQEAKQQERECAQLQAEISSLKLRLIEYEPKEDTEIAPSLEDYQKAQQNKAKCERIQNILAIYRENSTKQTQHLKWKNRLTLLGQNLTKCEDNLTASKVVKRTLLSAESLAITNLVDKLNAHLQIYLTYFFPDDPMVAEFAVFKQTKDKKNIRPEINLYIFYKGNESEFAYLSGGEQDRLQMCLTLALADMLGTRLILLDESISSLNVELVQTILYNIDTKDRLILLVAHQITEGLFTETLAL